MKTKNDNYKKLAKDIHRELDKMDKRLALEEEFHKTRSIYSACTLADLLYDILYN